MLLLILMLMLVVFSITLKTGAKSPVILGFWTLFSRYHLEFDSFPVQFVLPTPPPLQRRDKIAC